MSGSVVYCTKAHVDVIPSDGDIVISVENKVWSTVRGREVITLEVKKKKKLNTPCKFLD